jgi:hypothetical protein
MSRPYAVSRDWRGRFVYKARRQSTLGNNKVLRRLCLLLSLLLKFHLKNGRYGRLRRRHAFP